MTDSMTKVLAEMKSADKNIVPQVHVLYSKIAEWAIRMESPMSDPVAWMFSNDEGDDDFGNVLSNIKNKNYRGGDIIPLYTSPPDTQAMIDAATRRAKEAVLRAGASITTSQLMVLREAERNIDDLIGKPLEKP